jgi:TetR/AcrR family transcriptional repressor of nem operon
MPAQKNSRKGAKARRSRRLSQRGFVLAKTTNDPAIARESVTHLMRYVHMLFGGS